MKTLKILLVDDDADDQFFFLDAVGSISESIQCSVANNGIEAIDHLERVPPPPSIIFLDLNMPMMNGYETLERIKQIDNFRDIPVIIFTTSNNPKDRELTSQLGAKTFLTKTSDYKELQQQLKDILSAELT